MSTFVGTPIIQCDGGAGQDESSSDNDTSETSVDSSDEDEETTDDEEENDNEGSEEKRRATRSTTASNNNEKPKGRVTRQKTKEQTNVPTKRLLRSRKKSPVAGSGSKQPQVFPCPDCKKEFTSKVSVNKHRQWCKPKSTKASPRKKSETQGGSNKQDKPKQQEQQATVSVTPDKPRGRGRPRKSQVVPTPPPVVEVPKLPVEQVQSEIIEDDLIHLRSPESSPGIPDTSSDSDYEQREFAANVHVNNRSTNVTIDVVNPDPPFDPNPPFAADQVELENGPVQCSSCKMTYRTAQGYQKHVPTCVPYSSSDEDEDAEVDVQGFSENNEVHTGVDQLSIRESTRMENALVQNQERVIPQTSNEPNYVSSSEESSSMEDNKSVKNKTECIPPRGSGTNPESNEVLTEDSVPNAIADSESSKLLTTQKDEDKPKLAPESRNERMSETNVTIGCFNATNVEQFDPHTNVPLRLEKVENTQTQLPHHWENSHQPSPLKGAIVLPASRPNESHLSVIPSITNNHENLPPPPINQPFSADHVSHVQYHQERYNTLLPARTETQPYNSIMSSTSSNISATTISAPQQYFQQAHQNTPTYTQAQLMPGTVVNSVMQMQQMSTSFPTQDSTPTPHLQANNLPASVNASYMSSHNLIRAPNCVSNVVTSLPPVQPNAVIGNPSQDQHPHIFRSIDQRMPPPAQQQGPPQQQFSGFPQQLPPNFSHFQGTGQVGPSFAQQQFAYGNGGNIVSYGSTNNMQVTVPTSQQQQSNGLQLQQNQIPQTIDSAQSKQLRLQQIPSQTHVMTNQQGLTQHIQANGSQISIEGVQHQVHPSLNNFPVSQHQLPQSQFYQNQNQVQKLNVGSMAMLMQNGFNGQNTFALGGNNPNNPQPHPVPTVPYQLQQQGQGSQIPQPFVHQGQTTSLINSMVQNQQETSLAHCGPNPSNLMQNNYGSMLQNTGSHASQSIHPNQELQQQPQVHQQLYQGGHLVPLMHQSQNAQLQLQIQQQQELQRNLQLQAQQNSQTAVGQWNKPDISTNLAQTHQQTHIGDTAAVPPLQISSLQNSAVTQQQLQTSHPTAMLQQQLQTSNSTAIAQQQVQASNSTVVGHHQQQTQQSQVTPFIQQIAQLADGSTVILLTPAQPQNNTPGMIPQSGAVSANNSFQQTANVLNLLPGLQNIACQQQQQQSPQLSPQTVQCSLTSNAGNGVVPHAGSVGRSAPCPCPACKEKAGTATLLEKYKKVLPYPSEQGKQRQSSLNPRPIMIRPGPGKPQRTIRIQKAVMQSPNGSLLVPAQQLQQHNSALPPVRLVPLITKTVSQAGGMGVMMGSTETTNSVTNRAPISSPNIAVVRPMENPLQKLSDQISQIESTFMAPQQQQQTTQPPVPTMPQGPHLTLVTVSPPSSLINSPSRSPQIVASAEAFSVATGSPIQQQVTQLLEMTKSAISMDLNAMPQPRLTLVDHGTTSSSSLPSPSKTAVVRNGTLAGLKRKAAPTSTESGPNKSIKVTLRRKEGGDSYSINRITGSASGKGTMKSLKIKGQIKSGEQAGTLTDVVVVPVIHTVPIPDPDGDETESNRTIAEDGNSHSNGIALTPSLVELPLAPTEETSGESLRLTHRAVIVYEVQSNDTVLFRSSDVRAVWGYIFETVQGTRLNHNLPPLSYPATNISLPQNEQEADASFNKMGLTHRAVQFLLEQLPGMKALASDFKFVKPASPNQLDEEPIQENESGCARTEIFTGRKPFDMFGWLASKHRKAPDATVCNMPLESAKNMAAPLSMRYRKLKEKVDTSLVVWWSTVHGRGLYTKRDIEKGEMIIEYAGEVIRPHVCDIREKYYESKSIGCYMFRINDQVIDATLKGNAARFINHSCEPNCEAKAVKISGKDHILIFALRRVSRGEELTYDYKFEKEEEKIPCTCGSKHCRKYLN